jgi:hypothetical protein
MAATDLLHLLRQSLGLNLQALFVSAHLGVCSSTPFGKNETQMDDPSLKLAVE